jgi:hypothetical protein
LWLQLDQNLFNPNSRAAAATSPTNDWFNAQGFARGGYVINSVTINYQGKSYTSQPIISDTRMQIRLESPVLPNGDSITVRISYNFAIPEHGADRFGRLSTKNGVIYQIAQWFPRMCVYDDVEGWNTLPYLGQGEFYCEYGDYEYYITAPSEMIVLGSGDLQNANEVLTNEEMNRLAMASTSNKAIPIIKEAEIGKEEMRPKKGGTLSWHYTMKNSRDVAWAASKAFIWDAAKVNLPSGRKALAMSAYPIESIGESAWGRATEYLKNSIEIYSQNYFEYPWNNAVNIASLVSGMEYPGMIFCNYTETKAELWFLIAHEIGHSWYPMIVGSNERKYAWQDEGFNSFINYIATEHFNKGEYANDKALFSPGYFAYLDVNSLSEHRDPLSLIPDAMSVDELFIYYAKTTYGLNLLRNEVLGKDRFDYAFRAYTQAWAFKHPTPYDFFNCMNNAAGEDLNWFWKEWFYTTWMLDQAITKLVYIDKNPSKGAFITVENKDKMIMPLVAKIVETNGKEQIISLPVEIWQRGASFTFKVSSSSAIAKVIIDPNHVLPDINRKNNIWPLEK